MDESQKILGIALIPFGSLIVTAIFFAEQLVELSPLIFPIWFIGSIIFMFVQIHKIDKNPKLQAQVFGRMFGDKKKGKKYFWIYIIILLVLAKIPLNIYLKVGILIVILIIHYFARKKFGLHYW